MGEPAKGTIGLWMRLISITTMMMHSLVVPTEVPIHLVVEEVVVFVVVVEVAEEE
jgi:hypothetical protein